MRIWLTLTNIILSVLCVAGAALIVALSLGHYDLSSFGASAVLGLVLGIPFGWSVTRAIKRDDPNWRVNRPA